LRAADCSAVASSACACHARFVQKTTPRLAVARKSTELAIEARLHRLSFQKICHHRNSVLCRSETCVSGARAPP